MASDLYLIAHKVRGQPAFDIAHRLQIGDEEGWIIPTSGHRAYPYWTSPTSLEDVLYCYGKFMPQDLPMPEGWPDHYPCNDHPPPKASLGAILGNLLGRKPRAEIRRRV